MANKEELIAKWNKARLLLMKERREYDTDNGHDWCINLCRDFIKDLDEMDSQ